MLYPYGAMRSPFPTYIDVPCQRVCSFSAYLYQKDMVSHKLLSDLACLKNFWVNEILSLHLLFHTWNMAAQSDKFIQNIVM